VATRSIRFYFDYESPNAYLAWTELPALAERHGAAIEPLPVLYPGLLEAHGQLGPAEVPAKGRWMMKNLARKALNLKLPLNPPAYLPFNPLLALRVTLAAEGDPRWRELIDALFRAVWVRGMHVAEPAVVAAVADEIGFSGAELITRAATPEVKALLRRRTEEAVARGVFGVPSMEVEGEVFWGYDDFPYLDAFLAGQDPIDPVEWAKWTKPVPASSVRRRFRSENR
jgi:2-hydroxychromene-2-carboxylate isomerase